MAETILHFVLGKLADDAVTEVLRLHGVDEQVEKVRRELCWIKAFLKDADKKQITEEREKLWVKTVRDVAYTIEDVIDTFLLEIPQKPKKSSKMETIKRVIKKIEKIPAVNQLLNEIAEIQTTIQEIERSRVRYEIKNLGEGSGPIRLPVRPPVLPDIDPDIVGFEVARNRLVKKLLDTTTKRRPVVSIWGPGGIGKTTLTQKVYNCKDVKEKFGVRIWLAISQNFKVIDVLRKIARQLRPPIKLSEQSTEEEVFLTEIHKSLRGNRYLIVLDDVWTSDLWTQIGAAFPNEKNGSRVLITTRFYNICKDANPTCEPYQLELLSEKLSRELLLKTIFPNQDPNKSSIDDLSDILGDFIRKCGGLPLALVVLGGLLSKKPRNYAAWSNLFRTMSWHAEGKNCSEILGTSYEDLPFALKSCFMYFAAFPEDYDIHAPSLIRMWIAESFIPQEDNRTLEETAESFLEDLVQRSMVQVKTRAFDDSIKYIRIHDLLWDLAIQKAKEDNFLTVYSHSDDQAGISRARRVAIHNPECDGQYLSQNLRTLLCFRNGRMPNCSNHRLLKVVNTGDDHNAIIKLGMFEELTQIRYLKLTGKLSDECKKGYLDKVIGAMKFLQTLDIKYLSEKTIRSDNTVRLGDSPWHIKTLRHVNQNGGGPPQSVEVTNLQSLTSMDVYSWMTKFPHLPNLRRLKLKNYSSYACWEVEVLFLATLENLISLWICGQYDIPSKILDMRGFPFYQNLQFLRLKNRVWAQGFGAVVLEEDMLPCHLTYLHIIHCDFEKDVMPVLGKLRCLKKLVLFNASGVDKKMCCSSGGFSQLEVLTVAHLLTKEWEIEEGAMPTLKELYIDSCDYLVVPKGLKYLTNLQSLKWEIQGKAKANLVRNLCKHVPSLDLTPRYIYSTPPKYPCLSLPLLILVAFLGIFIPDNLYFQLPYIILVSFLTFMYCYVYI